MNVAVTDPDYKHSLGIVRALGKIGIKPFLLTHKTGSLCSYSKYSSKEIIIPPNYTKKELIETLKKYNIELIILVGTNSFRKIVPWKDELKKQGINIISVDINTLNIALSKKETYFLAKKIGVPVPKTFFISKFDDLNSVENSISYPCVIKGVYEAGRNIVDYVYSKKELKEKYLKICKKYNFQEGKNLPMIQEYIKGFGCGFFAVYNNGECLLTFQHKRIREWPVTGGASTCAESFKHNLVEKYGKMLLDELKWHGVAMVEFKMTKEGIPILMEINPKFWGSLDLALEAGVNFPKALIDIHLGKKIKYNSSYKYPFRYHWPLHGDILHAIANPKNLLSVIKDCLDPRVKSNIWFNDFKPTIKMFQYFAKQLVKYILERG